MRMLNLAAVMSGFIFTDALQLWLCDASHRVSRSHWPVWRTVSAVDHVPRHLCTDNICHFHHEHAGTCSYTSVHGLHYQPLFRFCVFHYAWQHV